MKMLTLLSFVLFSVAACSQNTQQTAAAEKTIIPPPQWAQT